MKNRKIEQNGCISLELERWEGERGEEKEDRKRVLRWGLLRGGGTKIADQSLLRLVLFV